MSKTSEVPETSAICALAAQLQENRDQFQAHFRIARQQILKLVCHLNAEPLRAILKIDEPQTFKFGEEVWPNEVAEILGAEWLFQDI